jgi:hypothetical protein
MLPWRRRCRPRSSARPRRCFLSALLVVARHLLRLDGADDDAIAAYRQAVGLSESPAVHDFLAREAAAVKE